MRKIVFLLILSASLMAETLTIEPIYVEDDAVVMSSEVTTKISEEENEERRNITMSEKLSADLSFSVVRDSKGEVAVSFRGLDYKNTRFVEDGIPLYTANVGVDTSFMMGSGDIYFSDGSSLSSTGISSMGGEVSIVNHLPKENFQSTLFTSLSTNDQLYRVSAGSMQENFYLQADASYFYRKAFKLSDDFEATPIQAKGDRVNSDKDQKNISLKAGVFVNDALHLAAKFAYSQAVQGIAPNTQENITDPTFFAYTRIDPKELGSLYLYGDYDSDAYEITTRLYYDDYKDMYEVFETEDYFSHYPLVTFDDARIGATFKVCRESEKHKASFALVAEENEHKRLGGDLDNLAIKVRSFNAALEDRYFLSDFFFLEGALSYAYMKALESAEDSAENPPEDKKSFDGLVKLMYKTKTTQSYLSLAKKSRMPQMYEMLTYFPWEVSNPNLKAEKSLQYTVGYQQKLTYQSAIALDLYYYDIKDLIVLDDAMYVNRESAINYGGELKAKSSYFYKQNLSFSYAYTHSEDSEKHPLELIPEHKVRVEDRVTFSKKYKAFVAYSFVASRQTQNSATYTSELEKLAEYHLLDAQLSYTSTKSMNLRAGVKNILDAFYERKYGYPSEGRSFYISLEVKI